MIGVWQDLDLPNLGLDCCLHLHLTPQSHLHFDPFSVKDVVDGGGVLHSLQSLVIAENLVSSALASGAIFALKFEPAKLIYLMVY